MKINRNNYEVYFMDHLDGKLSSRLEEELHAFLLLNPDLANEFEDVQSSMHTVLSQTTDLFPDKSSLHKQELPISTEALNELLVKEVDGNLSPQELLILQKLQVEFPFIANSRLQFSKTKLPAKSLQFENKQSLHFPEVLNMEDDEMRLIALLEGDLTPAESATLNIRLAKDSKLAQQYSMLQKTKLKHDGDLSQSNHELKFPEFIDLTNNTQLLIAKLEGDLTPTLLASLDQNLADNADLRAELLLIQKTKLQPINISFDFKDSLKKKEAVVISLRSRVLRFSSAAAAVVALIFWLNYDRSKSDASLASNYNPVVLPKDAPVSPQANTDKISDGSNSESTFAIAEIANDREIKSSAHALSVDIDQDTTIVRKTIPELINTIPAYSLALNEEPSIMKDMPEMKLVMSSSNNLPSHTTKESVTLLSYLGKAAGEKLENTFAYSLAERQVERLASHTRNELELERQEGVSKDKIRFRIGSFAIQTDARKKKGSTDSFASRINKAYHKISGN